MLYSMKNREKISQEKIHYERRDENEFKKGYMDLVKQ